MKNFPFKDMYEYINYGRFYLRYLANKMLKAKEVYTKDFFGIRVDALCPLCKTIVLPGSYYNSNGYSHKCPGEKCKATVACSYNFTKRYPYWHRSFFKKVAYRIGIFSLISLFMVITGCTTIGSCPKPPELIEIPMPITQIKKTDSEETKFKAVAESLHQCISERNQCENNLEVYR